MPKIRITDLPRDARVSKSEMANVRGGFVLPEEWGLVALDHTGPGGMVALDHTGPGGMVAGEGARHVAGPIPVPLP